VPGFSPASPTVGKRRTRTSPAIRRGALPEVTRIFTTPDLFAAGIFGPDIFQCSTTELRRLSPAAGIEPAAVGLVDVIRACTTPQTFQNPHTPPAFSAQPQSIRLPQ